MQNRDFADKLLDGQSGDEFVSLQHGPPHGAEVGARPGRRQARS